MPQACEAFSQKFRPCRAYADNDGLCSKHKYWYHNMKWFDFLEKHVEPYMSAVKVSWAKRILRCSHAAGELNDVEDRMVALWETARQSRSPRRRARISQFYEMLAKTGRIRPLLVPPIWRKNVSALIGIMMDMVIAGVPENTVRDRIYRTIYSTWILGDSVAVSVSALLGLLVNFTDVLGDDFGPVIQTYTYIIDEQNM